MLRRYNDRIWKIEMRFRLMGSISLRSLVLPLLIVLESGVCAAQSAATKPLEPAAIGVVYRLDASTADLKSLPDEPWKQCTHASMFSMGGWVYRCAEVKQERSSLRIPASGEVGFVFKTGSPEKVSLYRFELKGKNRRFDYEMANARTAQPIKGLPVEVTTYGDRSYKLVPASPLAPGEYAIIIADEVYTFGVD